jgi:hypothetical protein
LAWRRYLGHLPNRSRMAGAARSKADVYITDDCTANPSLFVPRFAPVHGAIAPSALTEALSQTPLRSKIPMHRTPNLGRPK